jgi:4-hydroxybenzoate polyprenyltransferase
MNVIIYSFFVFLITLITVIIKDIENVNGDLKIKAKTLPIVLGRKRASEVAFFFSCGLTVYVLIILQNIKNETIFLVYLIVLILLPLLYFMYKLWFSETKKDFNKLSRIIKLITFFGLLSMLLFKL